MMTRREFPSLNALLTGFFMAGALASPCVHAALGEPDTSATTDAQQLKASIKSTDSVSYRVHELSLPSGTVLREYAAVGGNVFAVSWKGPVLPDLRQALGQYFDDYASAAKAQRNGRHPVNVEVNGLIVQSGGHMRAYSVRAYLAKALPIGTSPEELR